MTTRLQPWMVLGALVFSLSAWAQAPYPSAPISLVVPFAAGSGTDAVARIVVKKLGERLNQPVLVDNKAGANGQIAATFVAKAKPDGYTLLLGHSNSNSVAPARSGAAWTRPAEPVLSDDLKRASPLKGSCLLSHERAHE